MPEWYTLTRVQNISYKVLAVTYVKVQHLYFRKLLVSSICDTSCDTIFSCALSMDVEVMLVQFNSFPIQTFIEKM